MTTATSGLRGRLLNVTASSLGARIVTAAIGFVSIPILVAALGRDAYGAYAAVVSLSAVFLFADQGLAVSARTYVAQAVGANQPEQIRTVVLATTKMMGIVSAACLAVCLILTPVLPWDTLVPGASGSTVLLYLIPAIILLSTTVPMRALEGLGYAGFVARLPVLGSLWLLATVAIGAALDQGLSYFVLTAGLTSLPALLVAVWALRRRLPEEPAAKVGSSAAPPALKLRTMWASSWPMAVVSIMLAVSYSLDPIVIAANLGSAAAGDYAVALKLYSLGLTVVTACFPVLWTHFASARAQERHVATPWKGLAVLMGVAAICALGLALLGPDLIRVWAGDDFEHSRSLLVAMGVLLMVIAAQLVPAAALTDDRSLRFQATTTTIMTIVNVPLSLILVRSWGVTGPVWASAAALATCHALPLWWRYLNRDSRGR